VRAISVIGAVHKGVEGMGRCSLVQYMSPGGDREGPVQHYLSHPPCRSALDLRPYSRCA